MNAQRGGGWRYDRGTGAVREFYVDANGMRRWADDHQPCPDQILKRNADLEFALREAEQGGDA